MSRKLVIVKSDSFHNVVVNEEYTVVERCGLRFINLTRLGELSDSEEGRYTKEVNIRLIKYRWID